MKKTRISHLALMAALLLSLAFAGGCAPAETEGGGGISGIAPLLVILVLIFGMFYFLMIRPMRQREKKHDVLVEQLERGDRVVTAGGIYGVVDSISEDSVVLRVESGATIRVTKGGVLKRQDDQL